MMQRKIQQIQRSGGNTPNEGFFESKNFTELDHIQRRVARLRDEAAEREQEITAQRLRQELEREKRRQDAMEEARNRRLEIRTPCKFCVQAASRLTHKDDGSFEALRRPLAPRCTCMDPTDGGLPVLPVEYPVDIDDWACKPFSTIASGGAAGYRNHFPLLMQRCTESEEKDSTQVQTETRRHSVVTTNYLTGRIKLEGTNGEDVHLSVFPVLHVVVSSEEEEEDGSSSSGDNEDGKPLQDTLHALRNITATKRRPPDQITPTQHQRRRSSLTPSPFRLPGPVGSRGVPRCRVIRRRSLDQSALALSFARALEAASDAMAPISEDQERQANSPGESFDEKHAEETMVHMAQNLHTLEEFLKSSTGSGSETSSSDNDM